MFWSLELQHIIEVEGLTKRYGHLCAVEGLSFAVEAGETFGLLGPNGAGKTTTIHILCTLLRATSGSAAVGGYDVARQAVMVRRLIGLVFQESCLDERLTARENLMLQAALYGLPRPIARQRTDELLYLMGLHERGHDLVRIFSGGMKRRLEIARGLIHRPRVLFLDEPTLGLDPQSRNRIWAYIQGLKQSEGITVFLTTHNMEEAEQADRVAILDQGRLVALDTPKTLKRLVGGDTVTLRTADDALARQRIEARWGFKVRLSEEGLCFEVPHSGQLIPMLITQLGLPIRFMSVHSPTLHDVFLALTGREVRDEPPGDKEAMRRWLKRRRWSGRY